MQNAEHGGTAGHDTRDQHDGWADRPEHATRREGATSQDPSNGQGESALWGPRLVANLIDFALVAVLALGPGVLLAWWLLQVRGPWGLGPLAVAGLTALALVVAILPVASLVAMDARGRSPGRWLAHIEVVLADGRRPGLRRGASRTAARLGGLLLAPLHPALAVAVLLVVHGAALFHPRARGLHDRLAGTVVVRR